MVFIVQCTLSNLLNAPSELMVQLRRKVTHVLFKITRAPTLRQLKEDCSASDKDRVSPSRAALLAATELARAGKLNPKFRRG